MPDWDENSSKLAENLDRILREIVHDASLRYAPSRELARLWQRLFLNGLDVPDPLYVGAYRGEKGLETVGVRVGEFEGVDPSQVSAALTQFEVTLRSLIAELDKRVPLKSFPDGDQVAAILDVCAWAHAEWVRIHPFANGNGRTARLWANWIAVRYGLPPFIRLRPRPSNEYGRASAKAMRGEWQPTLTVFEQLLEECLDGPGPPRLN